MHTQLQIRASIGKPGAQQVIGICERLSKCPGALSRKWWRRSIGSCCALLILQLWLPSLLFAQTAGGTASNMDLGSTQRSITAGNGAQFTQATLKEGRAIRTIRAGDLLTPAETVALQQVLLGGRQSLILGALGNATGGRIRMTPQLAANVSDLVVPRNVTLINDFASTGPLNLIGNLTDAGRFLAISTSPRLTDAVISAANILVAQGGLLTTVLPRGGLPGGTSAISNLSLTLNALNNISNAGIISSAGNLTLNAGGSIVNALPSGGSGPAPIMSAFGNVNLNSGIGQIINNGVITSLANNINILSTTLQNLLVNSIGGRIEALAGEINIHNAISDSQLLGGDWLSKQLNLDSANGSARLNVGQLSGEVNVVARELNMVTRSDALRLGNLQLSGDPAIVQSGDVIIDHPLVFPGEALTIVAGRRIISGSGASTIDTSGAGAGGDITLIAGALFKQNGGQIDVLGASLTGGYIDLTGASSPGGSPITTFRSTSSAGNGGNITLAVFPGGLYDGRINLPSALTLESGGGQGTNGNVTVLSGTVGGSAPQAASIRMGGVNTVGATTGSGNITIATATPLLSGGNSACQPCISVDSTSGAVTGTITAGSLQRMSISSANLSSGGGAVNLAAGYNLLVNGDVKSNGNAGDAGSIAISTNSRDTFRVGPATTVNGITGILSASSTGAGQGAGGSISIVNSGSGGVRIDDPTRLSVAADSGGGAGGSIDLQAPNADLSIVSNNSVMSADATGDGEFNGGTITLAAQNVRILGSGPLTLSDNGATSGDGGTVSVTATSPTSILTVGHASGNLRISATGGSFGSNTGDGGTVSLSSARRLAVDVSFMDAAPKGGNGEGAHYTLTATGAPIGDLYIAGDLSADGVGSGSGGSIALRFSSRFPFQVGSNVPVAGISGGLTANGGLTGSGGSVSVANNGTGGIIVAQPISATAGTTADGQAGSIVLAASGKRGVQVSSLTDLLVSAAAGAGGHVSLSAPQGSITLPAGTLSVNAAGGDFNGGDIALSSSFLFVTGSSPLTLSANGSGSGDGGHIAVTTTSKYEDLRVQNLPGGLILSATSGPSGGDGGSLSVSSGAQLIVDPTRFTAGPLGANGQGAMLSLTAGTARAAVLQVLGGLNASGAGTGAGGNISLTFNSDRPFVITGQGQPINGVGGALTANGGTGGGDGGAVQVLATGVGGVQLGSTSLISVATNNGNGGTIRLDAGAGWLQLPAGSLSVDGAGTGDFHGGSITLVGSPVTVTGGSLALSANGVNSGDGGSVAVTSQGPAPGTFADLSIDQVTGGFTISAQGGASGGSGGTVTVSTGRNLKVNPEFLLAGPQAGDGNGATYILTAGTALPGNLIITGNLTADASGNGDGGSIVLTSNSKLAFTIDSGSTANGINGVLSATGGPSSGAGGSIVVRNNGLGGILVNKPATSINVSATEGDGGIIRLLAPGGFIQINTTASNTLSASASGSGDFNGGQIVIDAGLLTISGPSLILDASAVNGGNGGSVSVIERSALADMVIGTQTGQLQIRATGGDTNTTSGNGGSVTLSAGKNLTVSMAAIDAGPLGSDGNGPSFTFTAGTAAPASLLVSGDVIADGVGDGNGGAVNFQSSRLLLVSGNISAAAGDGTGNGGTVRLVSNSLEAFQIGLPSASAGVTGSINVNAGSFGDGGAIQITNAGFGGVRIENLASLSTEVSVGRGASIDIAAPRAVLILGVGSLDASAAGTGSGAHDFSAGEISLEALSIGVTGGSTIALSANASGNGQGGTVSVRAVGATASVNIGFAPGDFVISATGGSPGSMAGDGGTVTLVAGRHLGVDPLALSADPLAENGAGAHLSLSVLANSLCCGLVVNGDLTANGVGSGAGGQVAISVNNSTPFSIGIPGVTNGVTGVIEANSGSNARGPGDGGLITVGNLGTGGIALAANATLQARSLLPGGAGGSISLEAGTGPLIAAGGLLDASAAAGPGGLIQVDAARVVVPFAVMSTAVTLNASAGGAFHGGTVQITSTDTISGSLAVGNNAGQFVIEATGGAPGTIVGDGGTVSITSASDLVIDPNFLIAGPLGSGGGGESLNLSAQGNLFSSGSLDVSGTGFGAGGSLTISAAGAGMHNHSTFRIAQDATDTGIRGVISANAGPLGGDGGRIVLNIPAFILSIPGGTTLGANASGNFATSGGVIALTISDLQVSGAGPLSLSANGGGAGNGGSITYAVTFPSRTVTIGSGNGQLAVSAVGGSVGSLTGNGGSVSISSTGSLIVNTGSLMLHPLGQNGDGASYSFSSGTGNMLITGTLDASGVGTGDGGSIRINFGSATPFGIGVANPPKNGINGTLLANAGTGGGNGGLISVAAGGELDLNSGPTLSANAAGSGVYTGGSISLTGSRVLLQGPGTAILSANGSGMGDGGSVTVRETKTGSRMTIGTGSGQLEIAATGGSPLSPGGDGGTVGVFVTTLTVNPAALAAGPLGLAGDGANLTLSAGPRGGGDLLITGPLSVSGAPVGNGGSATLAAGSAQTFTIMPGATRDGVNGTVVASAGSIFGDGGTVTVSNSGAGGIGFGAGQAVFVDPSQLFGGSGGTIVVLASHGSVSFAGVGLEANAVISGDGGHISVTGTRLLTPGSMNLAFSANAAGMGNGGSISLDTSLSPSNQSGITIGHQAGQVSVSATGGSAGSLAGNGGSVRVVSGRDLIVDPAGIAVAPQGVNGDGGSISLTSGKTPSANLFVTGNLSASGAGIGNGGSISLTTSSNLGFGIFPGAKGSGVNGTLSANAGPTAGDGGTITINSNFQRGITLQQRSIFINASAGGGNGGSISLVAPSGDISFSSDGLSADAVAGPGVGSFNGGEITITAGGQIIGPKNLPLLLSAISGNVGNGGIINVQSNDVSNFGSLTVGTAFGNLEFVATGKGFMSRPGNGGTVSVSAARGLTVDPAGITAGPLGPNGDGATVSLTAGSRIPANLIITNNLDASGIGDGNGGSITISTSAQKLLLLSPVVSNSSSSNGNGNGNGGTGGGGGGNKKGGGNGQNPGSQVGSLSANAGSAFGNGGSVTVINTGNGTIQFATSPVISAAPSVNGGNGGSISVQDPQGPIMFTGAGLSVDASTGGNYRGGQIALSGEQVLGPTGGPVLLSARGNGNGLGGSISVTAARVGQSDLFVGNAPGAVKVDVRGGLDLAGEGGNVLLSARRNLFVDASGLVLKSSQFTGATVSLIAASEQAGNLIASGNIDVGSGFDDALSLALVQNGTILQNGGVLAGTFVSLSSPFGGIGRTTLAVSTQAANLTVNNRGSAFVSNIGPVALGASSAGPIFQLTATGPIITTGNVSANTISLQAASIIVSSSLAGSGQNTVITLSASGVDGIRHWDGLPITAQTITLTATAGDIGAPFSNVIVSPPAGQDLTLTVHAGGNAFVTIEGPSALVTASAGGQLVLNSCGDINLSGATSMSGSVVVTDGSGALNVAPSAVISAGDGDVILNNLDAAHGTITIGSHAQITALAPSQPFGNIRVVIGPIEAPVTGPKPARVTVHTSAGGRVFFGEDSITALHPRNTLTAKGAEIQFDTGPLQGRRAITLGGRLSMLADPPVPAGSTIAANADARMIEPLARLQLSSMPALEKTTPSLDARLARSGSDSGSTNGVPNLTQATPVGYESSLIVPPMLIRPGTDSTLSPTPQVQEKEQPAVDGTLEPVVFRPTPSVAAAGGARLRTVKSPTAAIMCSAGTLVCFEDRATVTLTEGEVLISARHDTILSAGDHCKILVTAGSAALASNLGGVLVVRAVYQGAREPVRLFLNGRSLGLSVGEELGVGNSKEDLRQALQNDNIGRRRVKQLAIDGDTQVVRSEVSLVSLLERSGVLTQLRANPDRDNRTLMTKIVKTAACLLQVTSRHGPYSSVALQMQTTGQPRTP